MPRVRLTTSADPAVRNANQLVSYNLARARRSRGWTQTEFAERLEPLMGHLVTKVSVSRMERNPEGRERVFDAQELTAFALVFDLPISWFFLPSPEGSSVDTGLEQALAVVLGGEDEQGSMRDRFGEIAEKHPERTGRSAQRASGAVAALGWERWSTVRVKWLEACVGQERHNLDELFDRMGAVVSTYKELSISSVVANSQP